MRLSMRYQPESLDGIVGQPAIVRRLQTFVLEPYPCCMAFVGSPGVGKSATAKALVNDLGVSPLAVSEYAGPNLDIEEVRRLFGRTFRHCPMFGNWHVMLVEELELLPSRNVSAVLKDYLSEQNHPSRLIVIATSNDTSNLDPALLERFDVFPFGDGDSFAHACLRRLNDIWGHESDCDVPLPDSVAGFGWQGERYSMRAALAALSGALVQQRQVQA